MLPHRRLGSSELDVSVLSLGSWRTYERIPREQALAVLRAAREAGIDFLDDARYDDETGTAPMKTGWSEVLFGELLRDSGWPRDDVTIANKLWWEFWPKQSAAEELASSLGRMRLDRIDLAYSAPLPEGLELAHAVDQIGDLIASGKLRAWGVLNWSADEISQAVRVAQEAGVPPPCAAQLPYSLVHRGDVEDPGRRAAMEAGHVSVVASATLAGGALSGKYLEPDAQGRLAGRLGDAQVRPALDAAPSLARLAERLHTTAAALAYAFALSDPSVASVLFGATSPEQIAQNVAAVALLERLDSDDLAAVRRIGV
jgi:aryl-alcohol dehydrogenase-like predicted oxidoreductase